jgi:alpha-1,3-rhamnosyltransferase
VIVPAYNHERYVEEAIRSIWAQTYRPLELIVLNDGSRDRTGAILDTLAPLSPLPMRVIHKQNEGLCKTLNQGIAMAHGTYISIMASDDVMLPEKTARQVALLNELSEQGYALILTDAREMSADSSLGRKISELWAMQDNYSFERIISYEAGWVPGSALYLKSVLQDLGGFDESLQFEDYDLMVRLSKRYKIKYIPEILFYYRTGHGSNLSDNVDALSRDYPYILEKLRGSGDISEQQYQEYLTKAYLYIGRRYYATNNLPKARTFLYKSFRRRISLTPLKYIVRSLLGVNILQFLRRYTSKRRMRGI